MKLINLQYWKWKTFQIVFSIPFVIKNWKKINIFMLYYAFSAELIIILCYTDFEYVLRFFLTWIEKILAIETRRWKIVQFSVILNIYINFSIFVICILFIRILKYHLWCIYLWIWAYINGKFVIWYLNKLQSIQNFVAFKMIFLRRYVF